MATGKNRYLWDLMAVRLASLNQTLDPWIYILLRRSFCIKARDLCKHCVSAIVKNQRTNVNNNVDGADKVDNGDQQQHQVCMFSREPKCFGDNGCHPSKPDLLEVLNTGSVCSDKRNTQLPDVTETGQFPADCVCQIHIENNKQGDAPDEGLYVRFLILTKDCDRNVSSNSSNTNSRPASVNKSSSRSSNINNVVVERTAKRTDSDTGYTGASTKETQSTDVLASNHRSHTIH